MSAAAWAQQPAEKKQQRTTILVFDTNGAVIGEVAAPMVDPISVYRRPRFDNLIKLRDNFNDKLMKSVDQM